MKQFPQSVSLTVELEGIQINWNKSTLNIFPHSHFFYEKRLFNENEYADFPFSIGFSYLHPPVQRSNVVAALTRCKWKQELHKKYLYAGQ